MYKPILLAMVGVLTFSNVSMRGGYLVSQDTMAYLEEVCEPKKKMVEEHKELQIKFRILWVKDYILAIGLPISCSDIEDEYWRLYNNQRYEESLKEEVSQNKEIVSNDMISISCNEDLNNSLQTYIDKVPVHVLSAIKDRGYIIELVKNPGAEYDMSNICGLTVVEDKRILIQAKESKFRRSVVHEIFHAYDDYLGWVSDCEEFNEIFQAEKEKLHVTGFISTGHHKTNSNEYWAEACQMYIYDSDTLKATAPRTYDFVNKYVGR